MRYLTPLAVVVLLGAGCDGTIVEGAAAPKGGGPTGDPGSATDTDPVSGTDGTDGAAAALGESGLRLLTLRQYENSLRALFGEGVTVPDGLQEDQREEGFTSVGQAAIDPALLPTYLDKLHAAAGEVAASELDEAKRADLVGCEPEDALDPCLERFIERFGRRAFRRALDESEVARYAAVIEQVAAEGSVWDGVQAAVAALLASPSFLFRVELGEPDPEDPARVRFTGIEMASRLSFFLWNAPPDEQLLAAAEAGELATADGVREHASRMVRDPRAERALHRFLLEYFSIDSVDRISKDSEVFPDMSPELATSMRQEMERLVEAALHDEADLRRLLDTRDTFVDARLASLYGLPAPDEGWEPVHLPDSFERGGLLGTGGFLAAAATNRRASAVQRGIYINERLLCQTFPPPPDDVETSALDQRDGSERVTMRERLAEHRDNPECAYCHNAIDPVGLPFEHYDGMGRYRETDDGLPLDVTGEVDGHEVEGATEVGQVLAESSRVGGCMTRQMFRHAAGRHETSDEARALEALADELEGAGRLRARAMAVAIAASDVFRYASSPR